MRILLAVLCGVLLSAAGLMAAEGANHAWLNKTIGTKLFNADGKRIADAQLGQKKYVLLYFSAHWCPPCRQFTPLLVNYYNQLGENRNTEIVFVSSDQDKKSMEHYMNEAKMPWPALQYGSTKVQVIGKFAGGYSVLGALGSRWLGIVT